VFVAEHPYHYFPLNELDGDFAPRVSYFFFFLAAFFFVAIREVPPWKI
jgi:hypothetical protein